jgi:hypothetical protein
MASVMNLAAYVAVERDRLVGFSDLLASLVAAGLALLGGLVYSGGGAAALALAAAALAFLPAVWLAVRPGLVALPAEV